VGAKYDRAKLVESVLEPSKQIFDGYQQTVIRTKDGDVQSGVIRAETDAEVTLFDSAAQPHVIRKADIASRKLSELSLMPEGLEQGMTQQELADLISFLESQKEAPK
jgi:putative heme-binding domain-containing protein